VTPRVTAWNTARTSRFSSAPRSAGLGKTATRDTSTVVIASPRAGDCRRWRVVSFLGLQSRGLTRHRVSAGKLFPHRVDARCPPLRLARHTPGVTPGIADLAGACVRSPRLARPNW
jgi:hypothetical protein